MYKKLKEERQKQNKTCQELADLLNLSQANGYWRKEKGTVPFSLEEAKKVSTFLNKPIDEIFINNKSNLD